MRALILATRLFIARRTMVLNIKRFNAPIDWV